MAKLFLNQCIRSGATVHLSPADSITLVLPSGKKINIEVTGDSTSIVVDQHSLFCEALEKEGWVQEWPKDTP